MTDSRCPDPELKRHKPRPVLQPIGRVGEPIRALAFAGGGFDTAMQLGVVHSLLVARGSPPDVVIGCSAGAVNAVALAEVLQAADPAVPPAEQLAQRVARFRKIFDQYLKAPGFIAQGIQPDTFQVDTRRPLEPLRLPIHHRLERDARLDAVASRAGIINLYNTLLNVRPQIGTMTRALRRWLGVQAAGNIQQPVVRRLVKAGEWLRTWMLLGTNIANVAPLITLLVEAAVHSGAKRDHGATAGELIFRSRLWIAVKQGLREGLGLMVLILFWLLLSALVPAAVGIGPVLIWQLIPGGTPPHLGGWTIPAAVITGTTLLALLFGVMSVPLPEQRLERWWQKAIQGVRLVLRTLPRAASATVIYVLLMLLWASVLVLIVGVPLVLGAGLTAPPLLSWVIAGGVVIVVWVVVVAAVVRGRRGIGIGLLGRFDLDNALLDPYPIQRLLIDLFDPDYYGDLNVDRVVESALRNDNRPTDGERGEKYLEDYADRAKQPPIHVLVTVADAATADFNFLPGTYRVVDGLVAALAKPPFFPPVSSGRQLFVDGSAVANDPTRPLFRFLRRGALTTPAIVNRDAAMLHLYTVSPLPFSRAWLGVEADKQRPDRPREYTDLVDVVRRALALQRFRDARLERTLTELHTRSMPPVGTLFFPPLQSPQQRSFVRTWVYPIEPERPLNVNLKVLGADTEARRRELIAETVADGCRSALSMMMRGAVDQIGIPLPGDSDRKTALCRLAVRQHLGTTDALETVGLPGSDRPKSEADPADNTGPGLHEVCSQCALFRREPPRSESCAPPCNSTTKTLLPPEQLRTLLHDRRQTEAPPWPIQGEQRPQAPSQDSAKLHSAPPPTVATVDSWPLPRAGAPVGDRSTVSLLFSGGVFRGVFQVGVLNGVSETGLRPDVVAGASVGSITAAMAASTFVGSAGRGVPPSLAQRQTAIQRLAAAYLAIDRLVLTDRFADFIRGLTVRAAQARFSIRQADRVIRRFDDANPWAFNRETRAVFAGVERLTYVSPFELLELLEAFRRQQNDRVVDLLQGDLQELLDRAGVGMEILGAEPLLLLIREYVIEALCGTGTPQPAATFQRLLNDGLVFLATATNMSEGGLEVLGQEQLFAFGGSRIDLEHSLLASSAFPGVFRPRWEWEVRPEDGRWDQYIDGGVMDNLPLDAVAQFLQTAAQTGLIPYRPSVPHLVFTASLETETPTITDDRELDQLRHHWPRLARRARRLGYNKKIEMFARTQENLRTIIEAQPPASRPAGVWTPLDLWVTTVLPKWLCNTFAFHPMLQFRQWKQAASIAHGCASTLLALGREAAQGGDARVAAWGISTKMLPSAEQCVPSDSRPDPFVRLQGQVPAGNCWYRPGVPCPFSAAGQEASGGSSSRRTGAALTEIHRLCGQLRTHQPQ